MTNYYSNSLSFKDYMSKTYTLVALGLLLSTIVSVGISVLCSMSYVFLSFVSVASLILLIAEIGIAVFFTAKLSTMQKNTAYICYFLYSFVTGFTLGTVLLCYTAGSVVMAFATTTILFICMAIIGKTTNVDLTKFSSYVFIGLTVLIVVSLLNTLIFHSSTTDLLITYAMVIIFLVLIAMDVQRLRDFYSAGLYDSEMQEKMMIMGAFQLYLDFINLFLRVLSIFGKRRD
ncbi:MAG: Bax inhibitor-1/YccA family protein [Erysipelotrichaceae bacterium]|nr:Bax inhibitor-1/YccA family protein [Erysipelotrichaceae bacterium]